MLTAISINNYQSHKQTQINLHPGVNVFIGQSDTGKTAVFRALNWVHSNRPSGTSFIRHGTTAASVSIMTDDAHTVTRTRNTNGSVNTYTVDGTELNSIGMDVPEEVTKALNIHPINIQNQLDPPFLLSETSGEVARRLNQIAAMDVIDRALSNITSKKREGQRRTKELTEQIANINTDIASFAYLSDLERDIDAYETKEQALAKNNASVCGLRSLHSAILKIEDDLAKLVYIDNACIMLDKVLALQSDITAKSVMQRELSATVDKICRITTYIFATKEKTERILPAVIDAINIRAKIDDITANRLDLSKLAHAIFVKEMEISTDVRDIESLPVIDTCIMLLDNIAKKQGERLDIRNMCATIADMQTQVDTLSVRKQGLETELSTLMPNVCPLCGK